MGTGVFVTLRGRVCDPPGGASLFAVSKGIRAVGLPPGLVTEIVPLQGGLTGRMCRGPGGQQNSYSGAATRELSNDVPSLRLKVVGVCVSAQGCEYVYVIYQPW
jgi:hypothetical protein